jgi:hypothetical protein
MGTHPMLHGESARGDRSAESHHVYRLDFVLTTADVGQPATSSSYTLNLEERQSGEVRMGRNVALSPSSARIDVGLKIWCSYRFEGADLVLREQTEISALDEPGPSTGVRDVPPAAGPSTIHKVSSSSEAWVVPGTPTLVASMDEPGTHKRYQVTVTATKLL